MTFILIAFIIVVSVDQASKYLIQQMMDLNTSILVLGDLLRLTYIRNPGAAFGIMIGNRYFFLVLSLLACGVMIYYFYKMPASERWGRLALTLILGGAVGNLIDRIRYSEVTDFIDVGFGAYRWPVFNVADIAVTVGVILLFIRLSSSQQTAAEASQPNQQRELIH